jgi:GTP pyrophosphokinase
LRRASLPVSGNDEHLAGVAEELGFTEIEQLYGAIGDGTINARTVVGRLDRRINPAPEPTEQLIDRLVAPPSRRERPTRGVIVEGLDDMLVRMAKCCSPVPGDDIIGFVTVGRGVSVHRSDCGNIGSLEEHPERLIEVSWAPGHSGAFFVWIQVEALDRSGLLRDVTEVLSDIGANIHTSSSVAGRDRIAFLRYELELSEPNQLERALAQIHEVDGVYDAYRLMPGGGG